MEKVEQQVIRVLVAKPGLDGHDRGAKVVAKALRDAGMEVIYTGLRQSIEQIVMTAMQEDVQVIGLSILSGTHLPLTRKLMQRLEEEGMKGEVVVLVGGNIPQKDKSPLEELGVNQVFTTGSKLQEIIAYLQDRFTGVVKN